MTFQTPAFSVDGNSETGNFLRKMLQGATLTAQGVVGPLDCIVSAHSPIDAGVRIAAGAVVVAGAEITDQGSYYGYNAGNDDTLTIAATTGTPRSDLIVVRAEDPTFAGSPWGGPAAGQILFPRVISNVASNTTTVPGGVSGIALARVDMPATASTVDPSYITDLRRVWNPLTTMGVLSAAGPAVAENWTVGTTATAWPAEGTWTVAVPSWATAMAISWEICDALYVSGTARGSVNPVFGTSVTAPNLAFPQKLVSVSAAGRLAIKGGTVQSIGPTLRNTTQTLKFAQVTDGTHTGIIAVDEDSIITVTYQFQGLAALT